MNIVAEVEAEESALDRVDGAEDTSRQQFVGKLDVELVLQSKHQVDARMRRHPRVVQVGTLRKLREIHAEATVIANDLLDPRVDGLDKRRRRHDSTAASATARA